MSFPFDDWQFYAVSAICAFGAWVVLRPFVPARKPRERGCGGCPAGDGARAQREKPDPRQADSVDDALRR